MLRSRWARDVYVVASGLLEATAKQCGWGEPVVIARFPGNNLDKTVFKHPFINRLSLGMVADHVTLEQGTGAVHTAPGHGQEDYVVGMQYGLPVYCPVDPAGRFFDPQGFEGQSAPATPRRRRSGKATRSSLKS